MKFKYKEIVRIKGGFYDDNLGPAINYNTSLAQYQIVIDEQTTVWISESYLEKVEKEITTPDPEPLINPHMMPSDEVIMFAATEDPEETIQRLRDAMKPEITP